MTLKTAETHRSNILIKLKLYSTIELLLYTVRNRNHSRVTASYGVSRFLKTEVAERRLIRSSTEKADMVTPSAVVINLPESVGSKEAKKMVREFKTQIKKEPPRVILDLSRVKTMDCAGLHGLLTCMQQIARYDCDIQLRAVSSEAATLLELTRMDHLLQKFPSLPAPAAGFTIAPASVAEEVEPEIVVQLQPFVA